MRNAQCRNAHGNAQGDALLGGDGGKQGQAGSSSSRTQGGLAHLVDSSPVEPRNRRGEYVREQAAAALPPRADDQRACLAERLGRQAALRQHGCGGMADGSASARSSPVKHQQPGMLPARAVARCYSAARGHQSKSHGKSTLRSTKLTQPVAFGRIVCGVVRAPSRAAGELVLVIVPPRHVQRHAVAVHAGGAWDDGPDGGQAHLAGAESLSTRRGETATGWETAHLHADQEAPRRGGAAGRLWPFAAVARRDSQLVRFVCDHRRPGRTVQRALRDGARGTRGGSERTATGAQRSGLRRDMDRSNCS